MYAEAQRGHEVGVTNDNDNNNTTNNNNKGIKSDRGRMNERYE